ncbi:MAG: GNAT family N-acetyltransferase [Marinovum sp.]|nr:GNAT family N-acetyltransferase [Marinovum sp.]
MPLFDAIEPTWPALTTWEHGPFVLRDGAGGGKRVSAASLVTETATDTEIKDAAEAMHDLGHAPMFSLRPDQIAFDAQLAALGYAAVDPTWCYAQQVAFLTNTPLPRVTAFAIWEPLAIMEDIWAKGGIGPARLAVMHRVKGPKTGILGRCDDKPAGTAFVAIHDDIAMIHALEVDPRFRRRGAGRWIMIAAGHWAAQHGATRLGLLVTEANEPANALYRSMGFVAEPGYHYRVLKEP